MSWGGTLLGTQEGQEGAPETHPIGSPMALPQIRAFSQPDPACQPHTWRLAPSFAWMGWGGPRCPAAP